LDRSEVPYRAGSGLVLILKRSFYLIFFKVGIVSIVRMEAADPGIVIPFEGFSANFDLTGLNPCKGVGNSWWHPLPRVDSSSMSW
jgi:hypothetical protein